jgi:hypothetical protein
VILAEDLASAGETFAEEPKGALAIALRNERERQIAHRGQSVRVLLTQYARAHF